MCGGCGGRRGGCVSDAQHVCLVEMSGVRGA